MLCLSIHQVLFCTFVIQNIVILAILKLCAAFLRSIIL